VNPGSIPGGASNEFSDAFIAVHRSGTAFMDYAKARIAMVEGQVRVNDVTDQRVIAAFASVPREIYAPKSAAARVYADMDLDLGNGRYLMRARDLAKMLEALKIRESDVALEIACGRGYASALLGTLCESVVAIDDQESFVMRASASLLADDKQNVAVIEGTLKDGAPKQGPFDIILCAAAVEAVPTAWLDQLAEGGRLVTVIRKGRVGRGTLFTKSGGLVGRRELFDSFAPSLPGFANPRGFVFV
jgi:protein-L-isoaspartate(D-aspartate) O-methyltransferase